MANKGGILVYVDDGNNYIGKIFETRHSIKKEAKAQGHIGYLAGTENHKESVLEFFRTKPTKSEITKKRKNGFTGAAWFYL